MSSYRWRSDKVESADGREVYAECDVHYTPATYWDPSETDVGNPTWYVNGDEVPEAEVPLDEFERDALLETEGEVLDSEPREPDDWDFSG